MATCATPGLVTISPNIRLCRHKSVAVARGVALVKPDEPFLVKVCNFGPDQAIVRKNSILGFAEPFQGPMLAAIPEEKATQDTPTGEDTSPSDDPVEDVDLSEAPEHLHKQIREMLRTHSTMWDGTLGTIHATEHAIVTPADAVPIRAQPYRTGPFKRQIIADQINKMLKLKVIEPSLSAWASPVVILPKKNGKSRFCADYRRHNNITKNVDALKHASFPTTKTQLKSFLGMCNVYRRFVKDFAKRAKPLNAMTSAEVPPDLPKPTDAALAAFDDLRQALLAPPILALPKAKGQMIVDVDACADQLGCTLLQEQPDGTRLPVGYWTRGLSPAEKNYSTTERECLGVVWSVLKLRHFPDGHRFLIRTDHQALSWIYSSTDSSGRLMRWRLRLSEYTLDMQYKPGASHHAPDFLS